MALRQFELPFISIPAACPPYLKATPVLLPTWLPARLLSKTCESLLLGQSLSLVVLSKLLTNSSAKARISTSTSPELCVHNCNCCVQENKLNVVCTINLTSASKNNFLHAYCIHLYSYLCPHWLLLARAQCCVAWCQSQFYRCIGGKAPQMHHRKTASATEQLNAAAYSSAQVLGLCQILREWLADPVISKVTFLFKSGLNKDRATSHCLCWGSLKKSQGIKSWMQLIDISSISYFKFRSIQESHFLKQQGARKKTKNKKGGLPLSRCWKQNKRPSQNCSSELGQKPRKMPSFEKQLFRHSLHLKKRENHGKSAKATRTDAFWYIQPHMTVGRTKLSYIFAFGATRPKAACPNIKKQFMFQCFAQEKTMGKSFSFFISPPVQQGDPDFWHAITVEPTVITSHSVESCIMRWRLSVLRVELDGFVALR